MRYLSLFSGIESASVAWEPLGFEAVAFAEIDKFASSLLAKKYPKIPNLGDVTKITEQQIKYLGEIDIIVFGSPCQDLSVAGKRTGLEGKRSGLFITAIDIIRWARKHCGLRFALWENVPGAFSSNQGRDFATVVSLLAGIDHLEPPKNGWGREGAAVGDAGMLEWSVLDAQYFGVAQRRERVFALVDFGDWASRPPILLEPESLRGNPPSSRKAREGIARDSSSSTTAECHRLISFGQYKTDSIASTLRARDGRDATDLITECVLTHEQNKYQVRRLTPLECERLMGFPDNYTDILSTTQRYRTLGNSMAVPVMRWIGIQLKKYANWTTLTSSPT